MIKRILVAMDGSPSSYAALSIAGSLAGITGAELVGLFVEDIGRLAGIEGKEAEAAEDQLEAESLQLYQNFHSRCSSSNIEGRFLSIRGVPSTVIRDRAKTADFIVMGNVDKRTGEGTDQSETVVSLLRALARPLLVVPDDPSGEPKIVIAYDGSLPSDRALRAAAEFAAISDMTTLHLLTVSATADECKTVQAPAVEYLSAYDLHVVPVCVTGKPEEAIPAYVEQIDASVLVIGAFGPNRMKESVFGSTTQAVLRQAEAAVLLVS